MSQSILQQALKGPSAWTYSLAGFKIEPLFTCYSYDLVTDCTILRRIYAVALSNLSCVTKPHRDEMGSPSRDSSGGGSSGKGSSGKGSSRHLALRLLMRRRSQVMAYLWSIVRDEHRAEDLFQEVAILVSEKAPVVEDEARILKWILKTARYEALNMMRKQNNDKLVFSEELLDLMDVHWSQGRSNNEEKELGEALGRCLGKLNQRDRQFIRMRYVDGIRGAELASLIGRTTNATYLALSRIHQRLRECMRFTLRQQGMVSDG